MTSTTSIVPRIRYFLFPYSQEIFDSRIERLAEVSGPRRSTEIHVDLLALRPLGPGALQLDDDGEPCEVVQGEFVPLRLRFLRAAWVARRGLYAVDLQTLPEDHPGRRLFDVVHLRRPDGAVRHWLFTDIAELGTELCLRAAACALEERPGQVRRVTVRRRWTWRPPTRDALVSQRATAHQRYGGDPIAIHLGRRIYRQRLFIGGLHHQGGQRPLVDHVLNLCEEPNPWLAVYGMHPADRHACKGELRDGMTLAELRAEVQPVVAALRAGQRVLVHCAGGVNRSSTVCCATLMLLEGLTAEAALARVREHHPEAAPDPYHWLRLRWLERSWTTRAGGPEPARDGREHVPPLREALAIG